MPLEIETNEKGKTVKQVDEMEEKTKETISVVILIYS